VDHNTEAGEVAIAIAKKIDTDPLDCLKKKIYTETSSYVGTPKDKRWPHPDSQITVLDVGKKDQQISIGIEFKREAEKSHGTLTALGQSLAYLDKGYDATIMLFPESYGKTLENPAKYVNDILDKFCDAAIGIFTYKKTSGGFEVTCNRKINLANRKTSTSSSKGLKAENTVWTHYREGSGTPDTYYRYLKELSSIEEEDLPEISTELTDAFDRLDNAKKKNGIHKYISDTVNDAPLDKAWRAVVFKYLYTPSVMKIFDTRKGKRVANTAKSKLLQLNGDKIQWFGKVGQAFSKPEITRRLNANTITEGEAWDEFLFRLRARAHSLKEDLRPGLRGFGLMEDDGKPSELGMRFIVAYEREQGSEDKPISKKILGYAVLTNGKWELLLRYFYKLSEKAFEYDNQKFLIDKNGKQKFDEKEYLDEITEGLKEERLMRKIKERGGKNRKDFQGVMTFLGYLGIIPDKNRYRMGRGLVIDWPKVIDILE
jgi:hypothetical protein